LAQPVSTEAGPVLDGARVVLAPMALRSLFWRESKKKPLVTERPTTIRTELARRNPQRD
jgi:hypothetical protein